MKKGLFLFILSVIMSLSPLFQGMAQSEILSSDSLLKLNIIPLEQMKTELSITSEFIENHTGESTTDSSKISRTKVNALFQKGAPVKRIADGLMQSSSNIEFIQLEYNKLSAYSSKVADYQQEIENEIGRLTASISKGQMLTEKWKKSLDYYIRIGLSDNTSSIEILIEQLQSIEVELKNYLTESLTIQEMLLIEDQEISSYIKGLSELQSNFLSHLLTASHNPFWSLNKRFSDSLVAENIASKDLEMLIGFDQWKEQTNSFLNDNNERIFWHFVWSILFLFIVFRFQKTIQTKQHFDAHLERALPLFTFPWLIWFLISVVLTYLIYPVVPFNLQPLLICLAIIPLFIIGFKIVIPELRLPLIIIIILYVIDQIFQIIGSAYGFDRWIMLVESLGGLAATYLVFKHRKKAHKYNNSFWHFLSQASPVLVVLMFLSVLLQIFGYVGFSQIIASIIVYSFVSGLIAVILFRVSYGILFFILTDSFVSRLKSVQKERIVILKRLSQVLLLILSWAWLRSILRKAMIAQPLNQMWLDFYTQEYNYGELSFSIQQFAQFIFVFLGAILISNIIRALLQEDLLLSLSLKRGVPKAIAMMTKYSIVVLGFFLAVSSLGVGLDKLGFLAGGLGVGIGFGLQNIVANFISGLILIFERPIHEGDIIAAGTTEGTVKVIGLRSCTVRSWDGAEVIIPNQEFISGRVTNWTLSDSNRRKELMVTTKLEANPDEVVLRIQELIAAKDTVLKNPAPMALYLGSSDYAHQFRVLFWLNKNPVETTSEVQLEVYQILEEMGIANPIPKREITESKKKED